MALWSSDLQVGVLQNLANHETLYIRYHVLIGCYLVGHFFFLVGTILVDKFVGGKDNISIFVGGGGGQYFQIRITLVVNFWVGTLFWGKFLRVVIILAGQFLG